MTPDYIAREGDVMSVALGFDPIDEAHRHWVDHGWAHAADGMAPQVRALAPGGVDLALDVAGSGVLSELIELAGDREHVITIADVAGAQRHGVRFSRGDSGRAIYALAQIGDLLESGRFTVWVGQTFPLIDVAAAHQVGEAGGVLDRRFDQL